MIFVLCSVTSFVSWVEPPSVDLCGTVGSKSRLGHRSLGDGHKSLNEKTKTQTWALIRLFDLRCKPGH